MSNTMVVQTGETFRWDSFQCATWIINLLLRSISTPFSCLISFKSVFPFFSRFYILSFYNPISCLSFIYDTLSKLRKPLKKYLISYCDILFLFKYITPQKASRKFSEGVKMYHKIIHNDLYDTCFMYWPSNSIPKTCLSCVKDVIKVIL